MRYPKAGKVAQFLNRRRKGSLRRERADVHFINHRR